MGEPRNTDASLLSKEDVASAIEAGLISVAISADETTAADVRKIRLELDTAARTAAFETALIMASFTREIRVKVHSHTVAKNR